MALGYPSDSQLLEAVSRFLADEVQPVISDPAMAYRLKIALNSLSIVTRECEQSAALAELECEQFSRVLGTQGNAEALNQSLAEALNSSMAEALNSSMAEALREGRIDAASPEVLSALKAVSLAKLAIDNPRYSTYRALSQQ